ncbi:peptide/nickel transport system permease protein [Nocardioides scoriae]|uniref:Peptide/nickel transport system permease protein n=1 Tax=Nocardioides scoriae TaxID=642780 RepID=A0A1H1V6W1_9ACTN|nr:ABC transporter permease subunit [Nocardioides scoriae]SDS80507.1 peptide/nickel transport system permease protein [Nocardioides scoriae]
MRRGHRGTPARRSLPVAAASRLLAGAAFLGLVGALPWLSGRSAAYTVLRARYAELEATPAALALVETELGLDRGPLGVLGDWLAGLPRGDLGDSWTSGRPVLPGLLEALVASSVLMVAALVVALAVAVLVVVPSLVAGLRGRTRRTPVVAVALTALPELVLAAVLLLVGAVWLGWFAPYGWQRPGDVVLPALALGLPAGGLLGRLAADAVDRAVSETWVSTWRLAGLPPARVAVAVLRRALAPVLGQVGLVVVGLLGGAVAVEEVFAVPGLGRALLGAASAQDVPTLRAGLLLLVAVAVLVGTATALARRLLLGAALRTGSLPTPPAAGGSRGRAFPLVVGGALLLAVLVGLAGDPSSSAHDRLEAPRPGLWLGADASGRDLLARLGHGALVTVGTSVLVVLACLLLGLLLGTLPRLGTGPVEITNAAPPVVAGLVVAGIWGPSVAGAALAVTAVSWAPLASHTSALLVEARAQPHVAVLEVLGTGRVRRLWCHLLPAVVAPVARHAAARLPGVALALAALGFLGLGPGQPTPEWGLVLAEGVGYAERAPWVVAAPTLALVAVSVLAAALAEDRPARGVSGPRTPRRPRRGG